MTDPGRCAVDGCWIVTAPQPGPLVVEVPHAGTDLDDAALAFRQLPPRALEAGVVQADADIGADLLWDGTERDGVSRVVATTSRYVIDLNTAPRFPTAYEEKMPEPLNNLHRRSACGLRWSAPPLPRCEIERRVATYLEPYHRAVARTIERTRAATGVAVVLSSHTFPDRQAPAGVDVVIGTAHETAAPRELRELIADCFRRAGLRVAMEDPFPGGLSVARHGRPEEGVSAVQLEIHRALLARSHREGDIVRFDVDATGLERLRALMKEVSRAVVAWATACSRRHDARSASTDLRAPDRGGMGPNDLLSRKSEPPTRNAALLRPFAKRCSRKDRDER